MKFVSCAIVATLLALSCPLASAQSNPSESAAELQALADGYAAAFQKLYQSHTLTLVLKRDGRTVVFKDVRRVEVVGCVLVVTVSSSGDKFILNPRDVVFLTDAERYPSVDEPRG
jgi:hypothetical protein